LNLIEFPIRLRCVAKTRTSAALATFSLPKLISGELDVSELDI